LQAIRSVAGRAAGASEAEIESLGRKAHVDAEGNFVFRSMPSGTFIITARSGGRIVSRTVTLPAEPTLMRDIVLGAPSLVVADAEPLSALVRGKGPASLSQTVPLVQPHSAFRVHVGAFRLLENAAAARQQVESLGGHVEVTRSGSLHLLTLGPFASREVAEGEAIRLKAAGIAAFIVADRTLSPKASPISRGPHVVQAGAFRQAINVRELLLRLQRSGEKPFTRSTDGLTVVYVGPFETRQDAVTARERLHRAGFQGLVTRR
jgi:cell division septation protein DedD